MKGRRRTTIFRPGLMSNLIIYYKLINYKCMAEAVEGNVLLDAGSLYPWFEVQCHCTVREVLEYLPSASLTT